MLRVNDKIKYVKENSIIGLPLGTIFTVTDVTVDTIIINSTLDCTNCELHKEPLIKMVLRNLSVFYTWKNR